MVSKVLSGLGVCGPFLPKNLILIIGYHRVAPDHGHHTDFDQEVFGPRLSQFVNHLKWLKKYTTPLGLEDLIGLAHGELSMEGPFSLVTFDDGYADNYHLVWPTLERMNVPGIFFLPSDIISGRNLGWWDIIAYLLKKTHQDSLEVQGRKLEIKANRPAAVKVLLEIMKKTPEKETRGLLEDLAGACMVPLPSAELQDRELMTWEQAREVSRGLVSIGSHTASHRVLATLDQQIQLDELRRSKQALEENLGYEVKSLAYPVGGYQHISKQTPELAKQCGYRAAFTFNTGIERRGEIAPFLIRRWAAPSDPAMLAACAAFPRFLLNHLARERFSP